MNRNTHPKWHGDGTRAPSTWKGGDAGTRICSCCTAQAVPLRATNDRVSPRRSEESCGFWRVVRSSGTKWHDGPPASVRVHGRAS